MALPTKALRNMVMICDVSIGRLSVICIDELPLGGLSALRAFIENDCSTPERVAAKLAYLELLDDSGHNLEAGEFDSGVYTCVFRGVYCSEF